MTLKNALSLLLCAILGIGQLACACAAYSATMPVADVAREPGHVGHNTSRDHAESHGDHAETHKESTRCGGDSCAGDCNLQALVESGAGAPLRHDGSDVLDIPARSGVARDWPVPRPNVLFPLSLLRSTWPPVGSPVALHDRLLT